MNNNNLLEILKQSRFSALTDGILMGVGFIFIIFGIMMPLVFHTEEQIIYGLLAIIGGVVVTATGAIVEVYNWARLPLVRSLELEEKKWEGLFIRCEKCGKKTGHVLVGAANPEKGEMEETYECIRCGTTKKIYELTSDEESGKALEKN